MPKEKRRFSCRHCECVTNRQSHFNRHISSNLHRKFVLESPIANVDIVKTFNKSSDDQVFDATNQPKQSVCNNSMEERELLDSWSDTDFNDISSHQAGRRDEEPSKHSSTSEKEEMSFDSCPVNNTDWYPFESKVELLLYIFINSQTHPLSDEIIKFVLFMLGECGVCGVPSLAKLKKLRIGLLNPIDLLKKSKDQHDTPFWNIKPSEIIKLCVAHPDVSNTLTRYPTFPQEIISHPSHADKWHNDISFTSASWRGKLFEQGKLYQVLSDDECGQLGKILTFRDNIELDIIEAVVAMYSPTDERLSGSNGTGDEWQKSYFKVTGENAVVPLYRLTNLELPVEDLIFIKNENGSYMRLSDQEHRDIIDEQRKETDMPTVNVPINLFLDDTSANRSKRWLALHCVQMQLSGIPVKDRQLQRGIFYLGASEKVDIMDICSLAVDDIKQCSRDGVLGFDAKDQQRCILKTSIGAVVADYNMLSYSCNHLGSSAQKFCPRCYSDVETYSQIGLPRTPEDTRRTINRINMRSSESRKKRLRTHKGVKEHANCFWDVINPHQDIPVGLLHLILLGLTKHLIQHICKTVGDESKRRMSCHLSSILPKKSYNDFFQYIDSRQGKDFKEYLQIAPFNVAYGRVPAELVKMVCCLAKAEDIRRHGPPNAYVEDAFEKKHGVIRNMIFNENQHARSRDTALKFARSMVCHHVKTGGFFEDGDQWKQASSSVLSMGQTKKVTDHLGITYVNTEKKGKVTKLQRSENRHAIKKSLSYEITNALADHGISARDELIMIGSAVRINDKVINSQSWLKYIADDDEESYGIFEEGYILENGCITLCKITAAQKDVKTILGCPTYNITDSLKFIDLNKIRGQPQMIHDCVYGNCKIVEKNVSDSLEQESVLVKRHTLSHNLGHKRYILSQY